MIARLVRIPRFGSTPTAENRLTQVSHGFIDLASCTTPKMTVNHSAYVIHYFGDTRDENNARMAYRASLALFKHIQGQIRACMAATISIRPFTCEAVLRKAINLCHMKLVTALSCAAMVIQVGVQTVLRGLTYIGTNMYVKSMCV